MAGTFAPTMGIEEEFFVVESDTGNLAHQEWSDLRSASASNTIDLTQEIYREMIEVRTATHSSLKDLLAEQAHNRRGLVIGLRQQGRSLLGCGTHPLGSWTETTLENKARYRELVTGYGLSLERALTCGMHIHFGFDNSALLTMAYNHMRPYLPFIAAASAASPFWEGRDTRVKSYRRAVFDAMPRSGLPPKIASVSDYVSFCEALEDPRYFSDGTTVWWDARLNLKHSTLEIRVSDTVPELERAQAIVILTALCVDAALSRCPMAMNDLLIQENRWRATKFGLEAMMFCGPELKQQDARACISAIVAQADADLVQNCGWTKDRLVRHLTCVNDGSWEIENEGASARRFLDHALTATAACAPHLGGRVEESAQQVLVA